MGFFDRLKNGFEITKASLNFVKTDPEFLILPIIVGLVMLAILASFLFSFAFFEMKFGTTLFYAFLAIYYIILYNALYFTQAMILEAARERFAGKNPTLGRAFSLAMKNIKKIAALAVISAVVSIISAVLREKGEQRGGAGGLVLKLLGSAAGISWTVISYFALPVLLHEELDVVESFKKSWELFKKTWGENLGANFSTIALYLPAIILFVLGALLLGTILGILLLALGLLALFAAMIIASVTKAVIAEALYEYAATGKVPSGMPEGAVKNFYSR